MNTRALCLEKPELIISIDNIDLPSIANSSTMRIPEKAITKLPDTPQSKKTQKYDRERARNCSDILQSKGERIAGKSGYSSK